MDYLRRHEEPQILRYADHIDFCHFGSMGIVNCKVTIRTKDSKVDGHQWKVGVLDKSGEPKITHEWTTDIQGKPTKIGFSRDIMYVFVNDEPVACTAYISDKGFDLDLKFNIESSHVHIYSDVEGHEMTNYLFINDEMICCETKKLKE